MPKNLSISSQPIVWDETSIEKGIPFLSQKNEELKIFQKLWNASIGTDYYSNSSIAAAKKFKAVAEKSKREVEILDNAVIQLLNEEVAKDPESKRTKQLTKIAVASHYAVNYFTKVVNDTYYPTNLNWALRAARTTSNQIAFCTTILTAAAYLAEGITHYPILPSYAGIPMRVSIAACICFNAIRYLNTNYRFDISRNEINDLQLLFEKAITLEKAS